MKLTSIFRGGAALIAVLVVLGVLELALLVSSRYVGIGCYDPVEMAPQSAAKLERLLHAYESGQMTRDAFRDALDAVEDSGVPNELDCDITRTTLLKPRLEPYRIADNISVRKNAALVIQPGAEIVLSANARVTVAGRLYAIGSKSAPVRIRSLGDDRFGEIRLNGGPNHIVWAEFDRGRQLLIVAHDSDTHTLIETSRFNNWTKYAVKQRNYNPVHLVRWALGFPADVSAERSGPPLHISHSQFGLETPGPIGAEVIGTRWTDGITIERSEFAALRGYKDVMDMQDCMPGSWPLIIGNRFAGGEDDAIDLDKCSAFVVGNLIQNFKRPDPAQARGRRRSANGGGITGRDTKPVILNNVIVGNYHGMGFKDGARPVIINNTITDNNVGIALYQTKAGQSRPHGIVINNIVWNNVSWEKPGLLQDIVLNGKWWPRYSQDGDIQATIEARNNIVSRLPLSELAQQNLTDDPMLRRDGGDPVPAAASAAIDSGLELIDIKDAPIEKILAFLSVDYRGVARRREGRRLVAIDRGAIEVEPIHALQPHVAP